MLATGETVLFIIIKRNVQIRWWRWFVDFFFKKNTMTSVFPCVQSCPVNEHQRVRVSDLNRWPETEESSVCKHWCVCVERRESEFQKWWRCDHMLMMFDLVFKVRPCSKWCGYRLMIFDLFIWLFVTFSLRSNVLLKVSMSKTIKREPYVRANEMPFIF